MKKLNIYSSLLLNIFIVMFLMLSNVYLFESGSIQPSHLFLILFFCTCLLANVSRSGKLQYQSLLDNERYVFWILSLFVVYILMTNSITSITNSSLNPLIYSFYYLFNLLVFIAFSFYFSRENNANTNVFYYSILFILLLEVLMLYLGIGRLWKDEYAHILYFNNPNQMAYHALLVWSLLVVIQTRKNMIISTFISTLLAIFVILYSSSIAAMLAISFGFLVILYRNFHNTAIKISFILFSVIFVLYIFTFDLNFDYTAIMEKIQRKGGFENILQNTFANRGYETLSDFPEYLIFGMGEFSGHSYYEFHSTLGNIFRSYGLVGLTAFLIFLWLIFHNKPTILFYLFLPIMIYGIVHNGIRQPFFWIYLALVLNYDKIYVKQK